MYFFHRYEFKENKHVTTYNVNYLSLILNQKTDNYSTHFF